MEDLLSIAILNSRIKFDRTDVPFGQREILGDATETGLSRFAGRSVEDYDEYVNNHPKVFEVPFNSTNKWALVIVRVFWLVTRVAVMLTAADRSTSHIIQEISLCT